MAEIFNFYVQDNRTIQFPKNNLLEPIMQEDHNVAVWRFRIPKVLNAIDMSGYAWWFVYVNAGGQEFSELLTLVDDVDEPDSFCTADYSIDYGISYHPGNFQFSLEAINADSGGEVLNEWHTKTYAHKVDKTLQGNQVQWSETESDIISALIVEVQNKVRQLVGGATPLPVNLKSLMIDHDKVYLYTGSETGESTGYWYHWNGTDFVPGGLYGAGVQIDSTLSQSGQAAEAKTVGDALDHLVSTTPNSAMVDTTNISMRNLGGWWGYGNVDFPCSDGTYYTNPLNADSMAAFANLSFVDDEDNVITMTKSDETTTTQITNRRTTSVLVVDGLTVKDVLYLDWARFISGTVHSTTVYTLERAPAKIRVNALYSDNHAQTGKCQITKDVWSEEYMPWGGKDYNISDNIKNQINAQTDIKYGELSEKRNVITFNEGMVQCVDLTGNTPVIYQPNNKYYYKNVIVYFPYDGHYYFNPTGRAFSIQYYVGRAYNIFGEEIKMRKVLLGTGDESDIAYFSIHDYNVHGNCSFVLEDKRRLYVYMGTSCNDCYEFNEDVAYVMFDQVRFFDDASTLFGVTYETESSEYIQFDSSKLVVEEKYVPSIALAKDIEAYQRITDQFNNRYFDYAYPENEDSKFSTVLRYRDARRKRSEKGIIRIGSFNKFISRGATNYLTIKKELSDYDVDICGFQETSVTITDGAVTDRIEKHLIDNFQFLDGYNGQLNTGKGLVSHWELDTFDTYELLTSDRGTNYCIRCKMTIPTEKWYGNVISAGATLSVYVCHLSAYNVTVDGVSYTSLQYRLMEVQKILEYIAQDTSDFIVVCGDTNCFEQGFNTQDGTHQEWELFKNAGLNPMLPGTESTVTADVQAKMFYKIGDKVHCLTAYDQIFVTSNISMVGYKVVDSNKYPLITLAGNPPISDHCMVYADLKFDFDAVMQTKLREIAVTEPWW